MDFSHSEFMWWREAGAQKSEGDEGASKNTSPETWERLHAGHTYLPNNSDIGKRSVCFYGEFGISNTFFFNFVLKSPLKLKALDCICTIIGMRPLRPRSVTVIP